MWGTDQAASLSSEGMLNLTKILKKSSITLGEGRKTISKEEKKMLEKFKYWK